MNEHLTWENLNDYVDGMLTPGAKTGAQLHLRDCEPCRERLAELEATLAEVARVARDVTPPDEVWPSLRTEIERRKVVALSGAPRSAETAPGVLRRRWTLAAAAVALVAASSLVTALVLGRGRAPEIAAIDTTSTIALPVAVVDAERSYLASVQELSAALEAARPHLSTETIAIVERNLGVIDEAIAESRSALLRDPGNRVLLDVLAGTYRQKLDLLRRAAQLAAS
jgi:anti-sigma-K factor RskA